jgi:NTE family protein
VVGSFVDGERLGAYWGIGTDIANYGLSDALPFPLEASLPLAATPTRLAALAPEKQQRLVNWGYAVSDAALRAHVNPSFSKPPKLPY